MCIEKVEKLLEFEEQEDESAVDVLEDSIQATLRAEEKANLKLSVLDFQSSAGIPKMTYNLELK